jgi:hypothetical protein
LKQHDLTKLCSIEKETYALLIKEFIVSQGEKHPRFVLIGFDSVRDELKRELEKTAIQFVMPEHTGRLKEASLLRGKNEENCVVFVSRHNIGKFASLVTAFKILEEVINAIDFSYENKTDLFDLIAISRFLISGKLATVGSFIQEKMGGAPSISYSRVECVLREILELAQRQNSFYAWLHPRRILSALITAYNQHENDKEASIALFLRGLGIESSKDLEEIALFKKELLNDTEIKTLKVTLLGFSRVLRYFLASDVASQRRNIARLCHNQLRSFLYDLVQEELRSETGQKWTELFLDFEFVFKEKRRAQSKYQAEPRGVHIQERSSVSGLPKRVLVPLNVFPREESERNLLKEFANGVLDDIMKEYSKLNEPTMSLKVLSLSNDEKKLLIEYRIAEENGYIRLDTYLNGLRNPSFNMHRILKREV